MKEMLYAVRCLKSNEDMILALAGQFKHLGSAHGGVGYLQPRGYVSSSSRSI